MQRRSSVIRTRAEQVQRTTDDLYTSSIVLFELWFGVYKGRFTSGNQERLEKFLAGQHAVLDFSSVDSAHAGRVRAELQAAAMPIGPFDTLIAGQCLSRGMTLVTANVREFSRVPGLRWQDWSQPA